MKDWNQNEIACAHSEGGVTVAAHPYDNLIRTGCEPWPPPEIVQKLYQSRQIRAFSGEDRVICTSGLGFYCDLQSIHSEDAITWSVFGTAAHAPQSGVGAAQGKNRDKDQIQLRGEFLRNYAPKFYPSCSEHAVLGISLFEDAFQDTTPEGVAFRCVTWEQICALPSHPHAEELGRYMNWKKEHTKMANKPSHHAA